jgi:hypothetical protein
MCTYVLPCCVTKRYHQDDACFSSWFLRSGWEEQLCSHLATEYSLWILCLTRTELSFGWRDAPDPSRGHTSRRTTHNQHAETNNAHPGTTAEATRRCLTHCYHNARGKIELHFGDHSQSRMLGPLWRREADVHEDLPIASQQQKCKRVKWVRCASE